MRIKKISNTSEIITYNQIIEELRNTNFVIFQKLPISSVVDPSVKEYLTKEEKNYFEKSHFDFLIADQHHTPVIVIEFDGPHHYSNINVMVRDLRKNRICQIAGLPILRITDYELTKIDSLSIVQFILFRFKKWSQNYESIRKRIQKELVAMSPEDYKDIIDDSFIEVGYDPDIMFHLEHPFPLKQKIIGELKEKYNLSSKPNKNDIWYSVQRGGSSFQDGIHTAFYTYGIYQGKTSTKHYSFVNGKLKAEDVEILDEDRIRFAMSYRLLTVENLEKKRIPFWSNAVFGILPFYYPDIPGASIPDICESISEYIAFRRIFLWAEKNPSLV